MRFSIHLALLLAIGITNPSDAEPGVRLPSHRETASDRSLVFSCSADNDLFRVTSENGMDVKRFDTPQAAVEAAGEGDGVLLLADGYPAKTTTLDAAVFDKAAGKKLRLYLEYPSFLPGVAVGAPRGTQWERAVIASDVFAPALAKLRIVAIHDCHFVPLKAGNPHIVIGRVAGFDTAVFSPAQRQVHAAAKKAISYQLHRLPG